MIAGCGRGVDFSPQTPRLTLNKTIGINISEGVPATSLHHRQAASAELPDSATTAAGGTYSVLLSFGRMVELSQV